MTLLKNEKHFTNCDKDEEEIQVDECENKENDEIKLSFNNTMKKMKDK
jgi:hypothetical protein